MDTYTTTTTTTAVGKIYLWLHTHTNKRRQLVAPQTMLPNLLSHCAILF